jgi:hypothetical protein
MGDRRWKTAVRRVDFTGGKGDNGGLETEWSFIFFTFFFGLRLVAAGLYKCGGGSLGGRTPTVRDREAGT